MRITYFEQSGVSVGIPYIMQAIVAMVGSIASNFLQRKGILSTTLIRKIVVGLALLGPALFIVLACYTGCNTSLTVIYFTLSTGLLGLHGIYSLTVNCIQNKSPVLPVIRWFYICSVRH